MMGMGYCSTMTKKEKTPLTVGSWQRCSSRQVYDNAWISVHHDEVITPGGTDGIYGRVHFKNTAIGIVPIDEHFNTWLVGQYRYSLQEYSWEIPMGGCPEDEDPLLSAQRELKEETGLTANDWQILQRVHTSNSVTDEVGLIFVARDLTNGAMALEETEDITVKKLPFDEALQMAMDGRITDCISVTALLRLSCK